jgi:hypothetical protein
LSLRSMRLAQEAQVIPVMGSSICSRVALTDPPPE